MVDLFDAYRPEARQLVAGASTSSSSLAGGLSLPNTAPHNIPLATIRDRLVQRDVRIKNPDTAADLVVAEAGLCALGDSPSLDAECSSAVSDIYDWILGFILPGPEFSRRERLGSDDEDASASPATQDAAWASRVCSTVGLRILVRLDGLIPTLKHEKAQAFVVGVAAFTDEREAWVDGESVEMATRLLRDYVRDSGEGFAQTASGLLREKVRPLFARSKNPALTTQGRKNVRDVRPAYEPAVEDAETKPWKHRDAYIVPVLRWMLMNMDAAIVEANWPLVIPPVLSIIDDGWIEYKAKGCELLTLLLNHTSSPTLARTGLGEVFEDAVVAYLSYLPTLTPEHEALHLLRSVYPALIALANARFPGPSNILARRKELDKILRLGVLKGYYHAHEHVRITEFLLQQMSLLVDEMGVWSVRHLKDIVPLVSDVLAAPFCTAYPPSLLAGVKATQAVILNAWPRIHIYKGEILGGLAMCWCSVDEDPSEHSPGIKTAIRDAVKLLTAAVGGPATVKADFDMLVASDQRLGEIFGEIV